ncbi:uncharacterized protein BO66DRAFT_433730 [Aspergillus aculeatinus CBS 121060]|uniref:Uncharacterized protein n=1 Tax=Aspergillus aculeatinus CBS 121060 TaxID=1448322 RepID=A0ACD1HQA7_9EURO|nr:hypothetical protein BO66DRAFT_433730 [Aspergillus aculeatinus CBS 121060]RAH75657.1 hypothetical protein BO66DRAFT_433730 [Aspergillus aculeatinus CBS 121060]
MAGSKSPEAGEIPLDTGNDADSEVSLQAAEIKDTVLTGYKLAADNTIVATAIPRIADHFHAFNDSGWYASAYLLPTSAVTLVYGQIYTFSPLKKPRRLDPLGIFTLLPAIKDTLVTLLGVYNPAVVRMFYFASGLALASVPGAAVVEWRPISKERRTTCANHSVL